MTKAEWMQEEEERLIRLEQEIDSMGGVHRAHCEKCWDHDCQMDNLFAQADALLAKAIRLNWQRQDESTPLPVYTPKLGGSRADGPVVR